MPTRRQWRHILARAVALDLALPEIGYSFPVAPYAVEKVPDQLPCALIQSGGDGTWDDPVGPLSTMCQTTCTMRVWLVVGDPVSEVSYDILDDIIDRLRAGALASAATDELNPQGFVPTLGPVADSGVVDLGGESVRATSAPVLVPIPR